ncbi:MAG: DUF928 domain-containing protein [Cyanobacteria bacterium J06634_6]
MGSGMIMGRAYLVKPILRLAAILAASSALVISSLSAPAFANDTAPELREGLPGRRISGGSRSPSTTCVSAVSQPVIALMPKNNLGKTIAERPTFWFSLPAINQNRLIEFGLYDSEGELLFQKTLTATGEAGLTHLSMPETAAPLDINRDYRWYLSVVCDPQSRAEDLTVTGWVRRVEASTHLLEQLATLTPEEQISLYEASDLWFDALTALSTLHHGNSADDSTEQQWVTLLQTIDLPQVISAPFVGVLASKPL